MTKPGQLDEDLRSLARKLALEMMWPKDGAHAEAIALKYLRAASVMALGATPTFARGSRSVMQGQ